MLSTAIEVLKCPRCGLSSSVDVHRCACGYEFGSAEVDSARRRTSSVLAAAWFALSSGLGWMGASFLIRVNTTAPLAAFAVAGAVAGLGLRRGALPVFACSVTYVIGSAGAFAPVMATQAMYGNESFTWVMGFSLLCFVGAYGIGAALGFLATIRQLGLRGYARVVLGFAAGGALGGVLVGLSVFALIAHRSFGSNGLLFSAALAAVAVAPAVGGGAAASVIIRRRRIGLAQDSAPRGDVV